MNVILIGPHCTLDTLSLSQVNTVQQQAAKQAEIEKAKQQQQQQKPQQPQPQKAPLQKQEAQEPPAKAAITSKQTVESIDVTDEWYAE